MTISRRQTFISSLLLLSLAVCVQSQSAVDKTATSTIAGKVTVGGKGLQGVVVGLIIVDQNHSNRPTRFKSTTDEEGKFRITNVPPGSYEVIPASPAYVAIEGRKSLVVGRNETVEDINIALEQGGVITGKVTDAEGRPVIEEMVFVAAATTTQQTTRKERPSYIRNIRTDDRGVYRAYGVPAGKYTVSVGNDAKFSVGSRNSTGAYQRTYYPSASDPDTATVIDVSEGSETTNVDITIGVAPSTYSARGRIIDGDTNKPLPKTQIGVQFYVQFGTGALGNVAESNKDGEFKVDNLAPGKYAVFSEPPADADWHSEAVQFEVTDRDVEGLVIKTLRGASVSGVVMLEGLDDPKTRANLLATRIVGQNVEGYVGRIEPSTTINPNGSFRLTGLAAGRLMLQIQPRETFRVIRLERDGMAYPRGIEIKEHEQVTGLRVVVGLANGSIRGAVTLPEGLELPTPPRLRVLLRRTEDLTPNQYTPVEADIRGHFRVDDLVSGTYEIVVDLLTQPDQRPRIPPGKQTVVVTNGAVADVTITLQMPKPRPQ
ncbi:MAG TPA: carboxypeptidase regulatory-like domain-containing protein [Pyrinomonadaceae bacterium]|nr:carboxypeptidase regulatory-like domain-containing protein [Pyrinomonadaceae bacterium]